MSVVESPEKLSPELSPENFWKFGFPPDVFKVQELPSIWRNKVPIKRLDFTMNKPRIIVFLPEGHFAITIPWSSKQAGSVDYHFPLDFIDIVCLTESKPFSPTSRLHRASDKKTEALAMSDLRQEQKIEIGLTIKGYDTEKFIIKAARSVQQNLKDSQETIVAGLNWSFLFGDDPDDFIQYMTAFYGHSSKKDILHKVEISKSLLDLGNIAINQEEIETAIKWIALQGGNMNGNTDEIMSCVMAYEQNTLPTDLSPEDIQSKYKIQLLQNLTNKSETHFNVLLQVDLAMKLIHEYKEDIQIQGHLVDLLRKVIAKSPEYLYHYALKSLNAYSLSISNAILEGNTIATQELARELKFESEILSTCNVRASEEDFEYRDYYLTPRIDNIISSMKDSSYKTLFPQLFGIFENSQQGRDQCTQGNIYCNPIKEYNIFQMLEKLRGANKGDLIRDKVTGLIHYGNKPDELPINNIVDHYPVMAAHKHPSRLMELFTRELDEETIIKRLAELEAHIDTIDKNQILEFIRGRHDTHKARIYVKDKDKITKLIKIWMDTTNSDDSIKLNNIYMREQYFTMDADEIKQRKDIDKMQLDASIAEIFDESLPSEVGEHVSRAIHLHFEMDVEGQDYPLKFEVQITTEDLRRDHLLFEAIYHGGIRVGGNPDAESLLM